MLELDRPKAFYDAWKRTKADIKRIEASNRVYSARLDATTGKPLKELTFEEFSWLIGRFILPGCESERSKARREWLGSLVSEAHADAWEAYEQATTFGLYPKLAEYPSLRDVERQVFEQLPAEWPA